MGLLNKLFGSSLFDMIYDILQVGNDIQKVTEYVTLY